GRTDQRLSSEFDPPMHFSLPGKFAGLSISTLRGSADFFAMLCSAPSRGRRRTGRMRRHVGHKRELSHKEMGLELRQRRLAAQEKAARLRGDRATTSSTGSGRGVYDLQLQIAIAHKDCITTRCRCRIPQDCDGKRITLVSPLLHKGGNM